MTHPTSRWQRRTTRRIRRRPPPGNPAPIILAVVCAIVVALALGSRLLVPEQAPSRNAPVQGSLGLDATEEERPMERSGRTAADPPRPVPPAASPPVPAAAIPAPEDSFAYTFPLQAAPAAKLVLAGNTPPPTAVADALRAWAPPRPPTSGTPVTIARTTIACSLPGNADVTMLLLSGAGLAGGQPGSVVFFGPFLSESEASITADPVNRRIIDSCPVAVLSVLVRGQKPGDDPDLYYSNPNAGLYPAIEQGLRWANARLGRRADAPVLAWGESAGASLVNGLIDAYPGRFAHALMLGGDRFESVVRDPHCKRSFLYTRGDHNRSNASEFIGHCRSAGSAAVSVHIFPPNPWQRGRVHYHHSPGTLAHRFIAGQLERLIAPAAQSLPPAEVDGVAGLLRRGFIPERDPAETPAEPGDAILGHVPELGRRAGDGPVRLALPRAGPIAGLIVYLPPKPMVATDPISDNLLRLAELGNAVVFPDSGCDGAGLARLVGMVAAADPRLPLLVAVDRLNARGEDAAWLSALLAPLARLPLVALGPDPGAAAIPAAWPIAGRTTSLRVLSDDHDTANFVAVDALPLLLQPGWR